MDGWYKNSEMNRTRAVTYRRRLMTILAKQGVAYGFTLTVWGSGALAIARYGVPRVEHTLLFVAGPILAYAVMALVLYLIGGGETEPSEDQRPSLGFVRVLSVPAGVGAAYAAYQVPMPLVGIPLGSFLATLAYNLFLATELLIRVPEDWREQERGYLPSSQLDSSEGESDQE